MRWSLGRALPEHIQLLMSAQEKEFFKEYDRVVMKYMKNVCENQGLDITAVLYSNLQIFNACI